MTQHSESAGATDHLEPVTGLELQGDHRVPAKQVWSWALWDWATQPFNSVILTFVFTALYLTSDAFLDPSVAALGENDPVHEQGLADLASGLGWAITIAGILIAVLGALVLLIVFRMVRRT